MGAIHRLWRISTAATLATGVFHLINLVGPGRGVFGPAMLTPFRLAFGLAWFFLFAGLIAERRLPHLDNADFIVAGLTVLFLCRSLLAAESFATTVNWLITGAGVFFLVKHGIRDQRDIRLIIATAAISAAAAAFIGVGEYALKWNPLFESVQIDVIGADQRELASSQLYRVRSVIGHPGFVGAIMVAGAPLVALTLWRRRLWMITTLTAMAVTLLFSYSRGSWLLASLFLLPLLIYRARNWLRRSLKWMIPVMLLITLLICVDYISREEVWATVGGYPQENGLIWAKGGDGPYQVAGGEADGAIPLHKFIYFDVEDSFFRGDSGDVTIVIHYFDRGIGAFHLDYDSWDETAGVEAGAYKSTALINKTDSHTWTTAAFYLDDPRFDGRENTGTDFRIVDDDNQMILDKVVLQKGKLKLLSVVAQQWHSRASSITTRLDLYPFAWNLFRENPLGVGPFNTPGTEHHAVDSLPLTWVIEFGWLGVLLLVALVATVIREGFLVWKFRNSAVTAIYLSLLLMLLHGGHLMVLYDKPSLVLFCAVAGVYCVIRPGGRNQPYFATGKDDLTL